MKFVDREILNKELLFKIRDSSIKDTLMIAYEDGRLDIVKVLL